MDDVRSTLLRSTTHESVEKRGGTPFLTDRHFGSLKARSRPSKRQTICYWTVSTKCTKDFSTSGKQQPRDKGLFHMQEGVFDTDKTENWAGIPKNRSRLFRSSIEILTFRSEKFSLLCRNQCSFFSDKASRQRLEQRRKQNCIISTGKNDNDLCRQKESEVPSFSGTWDNRNRRQPYVKYHSLDKQQSKSICNGHFVFMSRTKNKDKEKETSLELSSEKFQPVPKTGGVPVPSR